MFLHISAETSICCSQIDDAGGRQYTYAQLVDHVHNCATSLSELGLRLGQRVCMLLANCIELPVAFLAVQHLGAVCVPINPAVTKCKSMADAPEIGAILIQLRFLALIFRSVMPPQ